MTDRTAALLAGVDAPHAVPPPARMRLVSAIEAAMLEPTVDNLRSILERPRRMPEQMRSRMETMLTGIEDDSDVSSALAGVDAPAWPPAMAQARLERRLAAEQRRRSARVWQMTGAAAAAVLVLVGAVVLARPNRDTRSPDGRPEALPSLIEPTKVEPSAVHPTQPKPKERPKVLGDREIRIPAQPKDRSNVTAGALEDGVAPAGQGGPAGSDAQNDVDASRRSAPGLGLTPEARSSRALPAIDPVTALLGDLLRILRSAGISLDGLGAPNRPAKPAAPAPQKVSPPGRSRSTAAKPARTSAAPAPKPVSKPTSSTAAPDASAIADVVTELIDVSVLSADQPAISIGL
ncbi:MAG: hypothetical protein ACRDJM_07425 [Actinomycetota bacterium]